MCGVPTQRAVVTCPSGTGSAYFVSPRSSEEQLNHAYRLLMTQLTQDHAEIRLSAFQVVDELFTRSHQFRVLLVSDFQEFLELTLGTDHEQPLPPPREAAQQLRQAAMRAVEGWNEKFGEAYKKLALGYHFLRHTKKVSGLCPGPSGSLLLNTAQSKHRLSGEGLPEDRNNPGEERAAPVCGSSGACLGCYFPKCSLVLRRAFPSGICPLLPFKFPPGCSHPQQR